MEIRKILAIVCIFFFFIYILWAKHKRESYLLYMLYALPIIDLAITTESQGGFSVFDIASYLTLLLIVKNFKFNADRNVIYIVLFLLLLCVLYIGSVRSEFADDSLIEFVKFIPIFIFTKALIDEISDNPEFTGRLIKVLRIVCLISIVFLGIQLVLGPSFNFYGQLNTNVSTEGESGRYPSFFHDPQKYAQYLSMSSFFFLIKTRYADTTRKSFIYFFLVVVAMFLTGARAAFGGFVVGMAIVYLIGESKYRVPAILAGGIGYLMILVFGEYFALFNRKDSATESYEFRNKIWQEALEIYRENATMGIGIGNYQNYVEIYAQDQFWYMGDGEIMYFDHPESGYLKMLAEFGTYGFVLLCLFLIVPCFNATRRYFLNLTDTRIFYSIGAIIAWMISYLTVYSLSDTRVLIPLIIHICLLITSDNKKIEIS